MKRRILIGLTVVSMVCTMSVLIIGCKTSTMKGATYVNDNAERKPMVFMTGTVGVLKFVDNNRVDILFPYAIDTEKMESSISIGSEIWISGEYGRIGNIITIRFKLNEDQDEPGILEIEVKDDGKTLLGENDERFNKLASN